MDLALVSRRTAGALVVRRQLPLAEMARAIRSASGWSHRKSENSSTAIPKSVSLPLFRLRDSTRAPTLPLRSSVVQYRKRETVPGSTQPASMYSMWNSGVAFLYGPISVTGVGPRRLDFGRLGAILKLYEMQSR